MFHSTRRRFAFYMGLGLFGLAERLNASVLDELAAATLPIPDASESEARPPEHWTAADNGAWSWYERESFVDGEWQLTGVTTPVDMLTGELYTEESGYLSNELVPADVGKVSKRSSSEKDPRYFEDEVYKGQPSPNRRSRHGRPPSKWLRKLNSNELRIWLYQIEVPEVGVSGMSFWTHLTRDHSFREDAVNGLTEDEQAKLHAAAHFGY